MRMIIGLNQKSNADDNWIELEVKRPSLWALLTLTHDVDQTHDPKYQRHFTFSIDIGDMMSFQDFQLVFDLLARSHTAMARYILLATLEEADLDGITLKADDVMIMLPKNCPGEKHEVCK